MRAYHLPAKGAEPLLTDLPRPTPGPGEIRVRIAACGLNFADLLMIKGAYQDTPEPPFTLGMEVAGTVDALGPGTDGPAPGTRIAVFGGQGGLADYGCFPAARAVPLPDAMSFADAAAFQVAYGTSHVALDHKARLQPGETLLVLGAAGGVGLTAVEIGKQMGARVIACARGADKLAVAQEAGADHLIDAATQDIRDVCRALGGVDVVYDPVGGDQFTAALRACNPEARILTIGFASGDVPQIPANHLLVKNITVMGLYWGGYLKFRPEVVTQSMATLFDWYAAGRLRPHVSHLLPLEQAAEALDLLRLRKSTGKVVVTLT
ncbi:2-haloacrylate reductase [Roseovarius sp. EC-HK134]|jgi:NADPH2:quinone reductase|uniref:2-haloacrylate reductase n=1 Tax=Roseovarius mucosus TaxID=215743 RepID=A0A1V0RU23_9RHOB|nr:MULTISPECIES: NADPH:quinone oxidoreductase family protein [Roseovarius]ARE85270.1 2-haloacrylate reductase [Roseovarius mucosus]AWZ21375.1 Oxidoreductase, zinc-binding dehydrogenase family [Roseovarius sp. AK1035]EDM30862.1 Zinc-binding dehydrogenase [Roseovarius sp. TM1035]VVT27415.1 2-haloacrylate reductase [Roseovarius sp. EC-SD190]VVT27903.1 2-haloacrylate reductase [Roseovarius sp. EC-HK134]